MLRRKSSTILLLTAEWIVRADLTGGKLAALWQQPRPPVDDLPMLVDSALRMGGKCRRTVYILTTDLWSQNLPLEAGATRGASPEELAQALAFEAEPLSGISAFESVIGHKALQSDGFHRHFWVIQMPGWQMEQIEETIRLGGGTLGGIAHPGGLPKGVSSRGVGPSWHRVELWPDTVVLVHSSPGKPAEIQAISGSPGQEGWKPAAQEWLSSHPPVDQRVLLQSLPGDRNLGLGDETEVLDLEDRATLELWLTAWSEILGYREVGVPLIQPAVEGVSTQTQVVIAAALATIAALGCWVLETTSKNQIAAQAAEVRQLTEKAEEFKAFDGQIKSRTDQVTARTEENRQLAAALDNYEAAMAAQRKRLAVLLSSVAQQRPEHLMVRQIEQQGSNLTISGVSLDPELANELAVSLDQRLRPLGWQVGAPQQQSGTRTSDRKPWTFKLQLTNVNVSPKAIQVVDKPASQPVAVRVSRGRSDDQ